MEVKRISRVSEFHKFQRIKMQKKNDQIWLIEITRHIVYPRWEEVLYRLIPSWKFMFLTRVKTDFFSKRKSHLPLN
jgi:hypothetical protein